MAQETAVSTEQHEQALLVISRMTEIAKGLRDGEARLSQLRKEIAKAEFPLLAKARELTKVERAEVRALTEKMAKKEEPLRTEAKALVVGQVKEAASVRAGLKNLKAQLYAFVPAE